MSDATRRAIRTLIQFLGALPVTALCVALFDMNETAILAVQGVTQALVTALQNALEDRGVIPSVLKATASSGANPVTHDPVDGVDA